ncbi:TetR/AcrR family transcriptional regulator [soil metagenome]
MPRIAGQIDPKKSQAILDAASELFAEMGGAVTMDAIAKRAGVSKQTLYNRFASKADVARAMAAGRSDAITAPLRTGGEPEAVLTALATTMLEKVCHPGKGTGLRGVTLMSAAFPDIVRAVYDGGPGESLRRLSAWLADQDRGGLLSVPDPDRAAEMFSGMVLGYGHLRSFMDIPQPWGDQITALAADAARRFLIAFAPAARPTRVKPPSPGLETVS